MLLEVTKSPPCAKLCGPYDYMREILSNTRKFSGKFNPLGKVRCEETRVGNVMEIRLVGEENADNSTLLKMALLHEALGLEYVPLQPVTDDCFTLSPRKDVR